MSKTAKRVLSMVIATIMLLSMLPTFTVAFAASPFSTAYNGTAYDGVTISKSALLVDTTITQANGTTITRAWEGVDYTFVVGTNAFSTIDAAFAKAKALNITVPDIIVTSYDRSTGVGGNVNMSITMPCRIFGRKWNVAPMNEMNDSFKATTAGIKDWTLNTNFASTVDSIKSDDTTTVNHLYVENTVTGNVKVFGLRIIDQLHLGGSSAKRSSGTVNITLQNAIVQVPPDRTWSGSTIDSIYASNYANSDTLTFKNVWFKKVRTGRLFAQENVPANLTFDSVYFDKTAISTALTADGASNFWLKQNTTNGSLTYKDCYISMAHDSKIINLASGLTGTTVDQNKSLKLTFENNVFNNYNDVTTNALLDIQLDAYTSIDFKNNYAYNTENTAKAIFANRGGALRGTMTVTGNMLLGFSAGDTIAPHTAAGTVVADNNFIVKQVLTSESAYKSATCTSGISTTKTLASSCLNSYYFDYDMKYNNTGLMAKSSSISGTSISEAYKTISIFTTSGSTIDANTITTYITGSTKELYSDANCTTPVDSYTLSSVPASSYGITTLYLKVYYKGTSYPTSVYRVQLINPNATTFNDLLTAGVSMKSGYFTADDSVVYLPKSNYVTKDGYVYADIHPHAFKFKVDNVTVFANTGTANMPNFMGKKNIIFTSGDYGDINLTYAANYLGSNSTYSPMDKSLPNAENDFNWGISNNWSELKSSVFGLMSVPANIAGGDLMVEGVKFERFEDISRPETTPLNVTVKNSMIDDYAATANNANYAIALNNKRATTTNATVAAANKDSFTLMSVYCKKMTANQLIHERVGPNVLIENIYLDGTAAGKGRTILSFFKTNKLVKSNIIIRGSNFRNGTNGNSLFTISGATAGATDTYASGNLVSVEISNNIIYNGQGAEAAMFAPEIGSVGQLTITGNTIIEDEGLSKLLSYTNNAKIAAANSPLKGNVKVDKNRIIGIPAANMTNNLGFGADNPKLTNTFYSLNPNAHERPSAILGNYVAAIGTSLASDGVTTYENSYYLD